MDHFGITFRYISVSNGFASTDAISNELNYTINDEEKSSHHQSMKFSDFQPQSWHALYSKMENDQLAQMYAQMNHIFVFFAPNRMFIIWFHRKNVSMKVVVDKGINYSESEKDFVCQRKNHLQVSLCKFTYQFFWFSTTVSQEINFLKRVL